MQLFDRAHAIAQPRDLADHVHALAALQLVSDVDVGGLAVSVGSASDDALGGDAEPSEIQLLQRIANLLLRPAALDEPPLLRREVPAKRRVRAARRMSDA